MLTHKLYTKFNFIKQGTIKRVQSKGYYSIYKRDISSNSLPVISYLNADTEKDVAIKQNKGKSGIYRWTNKVNRKINIGSSIDLSRRFKEYYNYSYISKPRRNFPIHSALLKYGYSYHRYEILEYCDKFDLLKKIVCEQYYMNLLKPAYNILKVAGYSQEFIQTHEKK